MVTTIRMPDELHQKIKKEAEKRGISFNAYVVSLMWEKAEREGKGYKGAEEQRGA